MAYDQARGVTVLFGGYYYDSSIWCDWEPCNTHQYYSDTWEWDGSQWTERPVTGPPPRFGHAMAYDSTRQVIVLFADTPGSRRWTIHGNGMVRPGRNGLP